MNEDRNLRLRAGGVYIALVVFGAAIAVRLFMIQLGEGDKWRAQAVNVATAVRTVPSDRGHIYSEDGRLLATSVPQYEVRMDMRADGLTDALFGANIDSLALQLADLFGDRTAAEYRRDLIGARARSERYYLIKRRCDHMQLQQLEAFPLFREGRYKSGLIVDRSNVRAHPFGRLAARTIGYVLKDSTAIGLEGGYAKWLQGVTGKRLERRLTGGVWMPIDDGNGIDPVPGSDIHTTIDINLQDVADAALEAQLRKNGAHHGCVVVMETSTGHVKAISNLTLQKDSTYAEDLNYAVGAATEPGSTFKTAALMVALEDGLVRPEQMVDTRGGKRKYYDKWMNDAHEGGYGEITLQHALEVSSNTGISQAIVGAYGKDPARFVSGLRKLGFGSPLGVRIPGEAIPTLRGPEDKKMWSGVSLPWMSIGYEVTATPLATLTFYNAIANKGRMMQPQFVTRVTRNGKELERFEPVVLQERICSGGTLDKIRSMLEGVVDTGSAVNLRNAHFRIAGKTGTAQIAADKAGYKVNGVSYQASFVGYFPADAPKYTCIVVVSSPSQRGIYGNVVAGPVFRSIADKIYSNRLDMQLDAPAAALAAVNEKHRAPITMSGSRQDLLVALDGLGVKANLTGEAEWVTTGASDSVVVVSPRNIPAEGIGMVPNVLGMGLKDALQILEQRGLRVQVTGSGMVRRQSLQPGSRCFKGSAILIDLAT
ncbi:MAG TPA: penicillin-binding protein [Flavobacteriales bacterium]